MALRTHDRLSIPSHATALRAFGPPSGHREPEALPGLSARPSPFGRGVPVLCVLALVAMLLCQEAPVSAAEYPPCAYLGSNTLYVETTDYYCSVSSASGAVGDVVSVTVSLHSRVVDPGSFYSFHIAMCHDPAVAELVGNPVYAQEFLAVSSPFLDFNPIDEDAGGPGNPKGHGFEFNTGLWHYYDRFPSDDPVPVMTLYYRVLGTPGQQGDLSFCNDLELGPLDNPAARCRVNSMHTALSEGNPHLHVYLPIANQGGAITVLDGPATHPERPPEPPVAKIYDTQPTPEEVNFTIRVTGGVAQPGDRDVPVEIHVRADVEYAGIILPLDFDERYLRLARAEHHFVTGVFVSNNLDATPGANDTEGWVVGTNGYGINNYRLAPAGEEIHAVTLYFDVLDAAVDIDETALTASTVWRGTSVNYSPWVAVRYQGGIGGGAQAAPAGGGAAETQVKVPPQSIVNGTLWIAHGTQLFRRGDANGDKLVDLSDAVTTLGYLFLGAGAPRCLDAADANDDGKLDVSDAITTLGVLFLGQGSIPPPTSPGVDPTDDSLDCAFYARG